MAKNKSMRCKSKYGKGDIDLTKSSLTIPDIEDGFSNRDVQVIRKSLLRWYDQNRRELPWRESPGDESEPVDMNSKAYGVWVSEIMLQQTRVQTVIDYYNRWMKKWPTIHDLAQASIEDVNEMWAGLGYYRRARYLLEGAKMVVSLKDGFPNTVSSLRKVPGVGDYTAGAIASIAFKQAVPVVDGNVIRVLARLKAISANPKESPTVKKFWKLAGELVDPLRAGDFNQSLMELGATLCTPLNPNCSACPIMDRCGAYALSKGNNNVSVTDYPSKVVKLKQRNEVSFVCVVEIVKGNGDGEFLMVRRPNKGLLAGLWEFPCVNIEEADLKFGKNRIDDYLKEELGLVPLAIERNDLGNFVHIFSHIRLTVYVEYMAVHLKDGEMALLSERNNDWKCVGAMALPQLGLTAGVRKVYRLLQQFKKNHQPETHHSSIKRKRKRK